MRILKAIELLLFFLKELLISNLKVFQQVVRPRMSIQPGFLIVPFSLKTDLGITAYANMITLTPGTLTVDVLRDQSKLLVHCMFTETDKAAQVAALQRDYERRIREVFE